MSLKHAILGFLNYTPKTGYELKNVFDTSVQHFWPADQSQIYRTLARLADKGLAEVEVIPQEDRPVRKEYHITPAGREELRRWLAQPLIEQDDRHASLIQVFFAGQLGDAEILAMFEQEAQRVQSRLARYDEVPQQSQPYADTLGSPREVHFWMLTLECGIHSARAHLAWLESVIERLKNNQIPSA